MHFHSGLQESSHQPAGRIVYSHAMMTATETPPASERLARQTEVVQALSQHLPGHTLLWQSEETTPYECDGLTAYTQQDAMKLDLICLNAITNKDLKAFENCEACGKVGLEAIIEYSIKNNLQTKLLHYCTSADISNDKTRVVGYTSAIIGE